MIEVIKPGVIYAERTFEMACRLCRALLRFKGSDVTVGTEVSWIVCPQCKTSTDVVRAKDVTK
jgi:hypothetical protein